MLRPVPLWVYPVAAIAVAGAGFAAGWQVQGWKYEAAYGKALKDASKALDKAAQDLLDVSTLYETERTDATETAVYTQTEIRTIYKDRVISPDCAAPAAARSVLEGAVASANARAAGQPRDPLR